MSAKAVIVASKADKALSKLPLRIQKKIVKVFDQILANPNIGIKLHGELGDYRKCRVGDYRIVYRLNSEEGIVLIVKIEHRQGVYK